MQERRTKKFVLALSLSERAMLQRLADRERLPAAAVVRRLVWTEAQRRGLLPQEGEVHFQQQAVRVCHERGKQ